MHEEEKAILLSLVSVAWSSGTFDEREREMIEALMESFGASPEESEEIRAYAEKPRTLEDIPLTELSYDDRRLLMNHAVVLSWVDGDQDEKERTFLAALLEHLHIPKEEGDALMAAANERAKKLLSLLETGDG